MDINKVLYISQEITPYLSENPMSALGQELPQGIQELGYEVRTFMPKYGCIKERRNQLHEYCYRRFRPSSDYKGRYTAADPHAGIFY